MGNSMVDVKKGGLIQRWINSKLHQMLGGRNLEFNGQGQIVQSENNCYPSIRVAFIDWGKTAAP